MKRIFSPYVLRDVLALTERSPPMGKSPPVELARPTGGGPNRKQITVDAVCRSVRVSQKTLNLLRECERCFWLHLHGVRRPEGPWPTLTRGLDTVISHYCAPYRDKQVLPPLLFHHLGGRLVTVRIGPCVDADTGLTLVDRLDECLEVDEGLFAPLDHKTRGLALNGVQDAQRLQLDIYTLLLAENGYSVADYGVLVYYVPVDGKLHEGFPFQIYVRRIDTDAERARMWLRRARAVLELPGPPEASPHCAYCGHEPADVASVHRTRATTRRGYSQVDRPRAGPGGERVRDGQHRVCAAGGDHRPPRGCLDNGRPVRLRGSR